MNNTINKILKYSIITGLALIAFIPLYIADPSYFPFFGSSLFFLFITGKAFIFRILVEIVVLLWLVLVLREKGTNDAGTDRSVAPRVNALTIGVTVFTVIVLIADLFGVDPLRSIWSNFERMEGWITIVHLWIYFIVLSSIFGRSNVAIKEERKNWHRFLNVVLSASVIVGLYGISQLFGWTEVHQSVSRLDSTLGNAAYLAVYMLISAFISLYMAVTSYYHRLSIRGSADILVWVYSILAVFFAFIIFETSTRGTLLGLIAGVLVACAIYAIFGRSNVENGKEKGQSNQRRMIAGGIIILVIIIGSLLYFNRDAKWIQNNQTLNRMTSISLSSMKTEGRGFIWPVAIKESFGSFKTTVIGSGQESFNYYFNKDYNPLMYGQEQWFDRAHSVYLDWLVAGGLLGLLAYLALYIISIVYISKSSLTMGQKSVLIALLVGYGIHNIFVFDNQTSYVMFFMFLAFVHSFRSGEVPKFLHDTKNKITEDYYTVRDYILVPILVILFIVALYFVNIRNIQANTRLIDALRSCSNGGSLSSALFEKALALNQSTANQEIREQLLSCATGVINSDKISSKTKEDYYQLVKKEVDRQIAETPGDARIYVLAGSFFTNIRDWNNALPLLEKAHELTPAKQTVNFELGTVYINTGRSKDALDIIEKAYNSAPQYDIAKSAYVMALVNNGEEKKAREVFPNEPELFSSPTVLSVYIKQKQFDKVIEIYKKQLEKNPDDAQTRIYLAAAYLENKQSWLAISELKIVAQKNPTAKDQIDAAIKQIQEGKKPL